MTCTLKQSYTITCFKGMICKGVNQLASDCHVCLKRGQWVTVVLSMKLYSRAVGSDNELSFPGTVHPAVAWKKEPDQPPYGGTSFWPQWSHPFSHYPKLATTGECWNVNQRVNREFHHPAHAKVCYMLPRVGLMCEMWRATSFWSATNWTFKVIILFVVKDY